ncbi:hypothetical protein FHR38_000271 [Micromonospora polyrhachis]|uniref:Uncharacterized protein n=1 Tax=Micromonospora polyrhachis TaxID=1282883 RepID=A0A7W7WMV0_9ACTN|nr:hypothetical protein [Micromonospora polyrhachis]
MPSGMRPIGRILRRNPWSCKRSLGFPRPQHLRLQLSDKQFAEMRAALVEIIGVECHVIEA